MTDAQPTVLVIEDDAYYAEILGQRFEKAGYKVLLAETGEIGLKTAIRKQPDIVTLDVMLPGMNGFSVLRELKGSTETAHIPVIMHTSLGQREDIERAFDIGCEDYLIKSQFTPAEVVDRVGLSVPVHK